METNNVPSIEETLKDILQILEEDAKIDGKIIKMTLDNTEYWCYVNVYFILIAFSPEEYQLSFTINNYEIENVAYLTHILSLYLQEDLHIYKDNFIDLKNEKMYFGTDAYTAYENHVHDKNGFIQCEFCEKYVPKSIYNAEKMYCKVCEELVIPNMIVN